MPTESLLLVSGNFTIHMFFSQFYSMGLWVGFNRCELQGDSGSCFLHFGGLSLSFPIRDCNTIHRILGDLRRQLKFTQGSGFISALLTRYPRRSSCDFLDLVVLACQLGGALFINQWVVGSREKLRTKDEKRGTRALSEMPVIMPNSHKTAALSAPYLTWTIFEWAFGWGWAWKLDMRCAIHKWERTEDWGREIEGRGPSLFFYLRICPRQTRPSCNCNWPIDQLCFRITV